MKRLSFGGLSPWLARLALVGVLTLGLGPSLAFPPIAAAAGTGGPPVLAMYYAWFDPNS